MGAARTVDGERRIGLAALDLRTLRLLPFAPSLPEGTQDIRDLAASPTTAYVAYSDESWPPDGPATIAAYDLRTGESLPGFPVTEFEDGSFRAMVYVRGKLIVTGFTDRTPAGGAMIAYHPVTGERIWTTRNSFVDGIVTNGGRLFAGLGATARGFPAIAAFDAATGRRVPKWGSSIPKPEWHGRVYGLDDKRIFGAVVEYNGDGYRRLVLRQADGRPVSLPRLPKGAAPRFGTSRYIIGEIDVGRGRYGGVFDFTGKLVGTICSRWAVLTARDDRHLVVREVSLTAQTTRLFILAPPR